jgi:hypothetical protein
MSDSGNNTEGTSALDPKVVPLNVAPPAEAQAAVKAQAAETQALQILNGPKLVITTDAEYKAAGAQFAVCKERIKALEAEQEEIVKPIRTGLDRIYALFRGAKARYQEALTFLEGPMKAWVIEQDRLRREAEDKARREAEEERKRKEQERLAAEAELERIRKEQEEADRAAQTETNPFLKAAREAAAASAASAVSSASESFKESIREQRRAEIAPLQVAVPLVRAAGTKVNRPWKWEYADKALIPREMLIPNEQLIGATVRSLKGDTNIPGIRVFQDVAIGGR